MLDETVRFWQEVRDGRDSTTRIDLPRDMVDLLKWHSKTQGFTLAQQILAILKTYLENHQDPILKANDSILYIAGAMSSDVGDLSVHHDRYLYGEGE